MPTLAQWIATAVCGIVLCGLMVAGSRQPAASPVVLPTLKLPSRRPAVPAVKTPRPEPSIRVNVTATPQTELNLHVRGPYLVRSLTSRRELSQGESLADTVVTADADGLKIGRKKFTETVLEIVPTKNDLIGVNDHAYHGTVQVYRMKSGQLTAINVLPLEQYVSCVIDAEMPAKFPPAAREAQAIVARTYALWQMQQADPAANYDVHATVRSQKYLGAEYKDAKGRRLAGESASSRQAAAATRGQVCKAGERNFCTYYSAVCGGATTPGKAFFSDADPVLKSVPCDWCRESDKYRWETELTPKALLTALGKQPEGKKLTALKSIRQTAGPQAGIVSQWEISDGQRTVSVNGVSLRQQLPQGKLLSPHFAMKLTEGKIRVTGHGHGHGAGLCQWGARGLAQAGKTAQEIVEYYYPGAKVTHMDPRK